MRELSFDLFSIRGADFTLLCTLYTWKRNFVDTASKGLYNSRTFPDRERLGIGSSLMSQNLIIVVSIIVVVVETPTG